MKNGVPFEIAFGISPENRAYATLEPIERNAAAVIFAIFDGGKFNFETMRFDEA